MQLPKLLRLGTTTATGSRKILLLFNDLIFGGSIPLGSTNPLFKLETILSHRWSRAQSRDISAACLNFARHDGCEQRRGAFDPSGSLAVQLSCLIKIAVQATGREFKTIGPSKRACFYKCAGEIDRNGKRSGQHRVAGYDFRRIPYAAATI